MPGVMDFVIGIDPEPSAAIIYPERRLGLAIMLQALKDLKHKDPIRCLDALEWWVNDAPIWVNYLLDVNLDPADVFIFAIGGANYGRLTICGPSAKSHENYEHSRDTTIPARNKKALAWLD